LAAKFRARLRNGDISSDAEIQIQSKSTRRSIMVQPNLFPHAAGGHSPANAKQLHPQKALNAARSGEPASSQPPNRQSAQRAELPQQGYTQNASRTVPTAYFHPQEDARIHLSGRIGRYFDVKRTQSGKLLAVFSVATAGSYKDESGQWQKKTAWQRVVVWGEAAEAVAQFLRKGAQVEVEGKLKTREWSDRENRLHTTTELVARDVRFPDAAENRMAA
jgi:primosomal replication protein N